MLRPAHVEGTRSGVQRRGDAAPDVNGPARRDRVVAATPRREKSRRRRYARLATPEGLRATLCGGNASSANAPHVRRSSHEAPNLYYTAASCEIVGRRFAIDFETFGYDPDECLGRR